MRRQAHLAVQLLLSLPLFACGATSPLVQHVNPTDSKLPDQSSSFAYALPRTVVRVSYAASRSDFAAPECDIEGNDDQRRALFIALQINDLKEKFHAMKLTPPFQLYSLKDGALSTTSEPDPDEVFITSMTQEYFADTSLKVSLAADGTLGAAETSAKDTVAPTIVKLIEASGTVLGAALPLKSTEFAQALNNQGSSVETLNNALGSVKIVSGIEKGPLSGGERQRAARECQVKVGRYLELEDQRRELLAMKVSHPKDAYELRLNELRGAQDVLRAAFLGLKSTTTGTITCDVVPTRNDKALALLTFSSTAGVAKGERADCRIPAPFRRAGAVQDDKAVALAVNFERVTSAFDKLWEAVGESPPPSAGFFYRMPGVGVVEVIDAKREALSLAIAPQRVTIAQFGHVLSYPQVKGANPKVTFELYPETGALKSVLVEEHAPDVSGAVGSLAGATKEVLTAEKTRRDAAATKRETAANEELTRLQREKGILEATLAIREARKALGL